MNSRVVPPARNGSESHISEDQRHLACRVEKLRMRCFELLDRGDQSAPGGFEQLWLFRSATRFMSRGVEEMRDAVRVVGMGLRKRANLSAQGHERAQKSFPFPRRQMGRLPNPPLHLLPLLFPHVFTSNGGGKPSTAESREPLVSPA